jgi:hypothetical protein
MHLTRQVVRQARDSLLPQRRFCDVHFLVTGDARRLPRVNLVRVAEQRPVRLEDPRVLSGIAVVCLRDLRERIPAIHGIEAGLWRRLYHL